MYQITKCYQVEIVGRLLNHYFGAPLCWKADMAEICLEIFVVQTASKQVYVVWLWGFYNRKWQAMSWQ